MPEPRACASRRARVDFSGLAGCFRELPIVPSVRRFVHLAGTAAKAVALILRPRPNGSAQCSDSLSVTWSLCASSQVRAEAPVPEDFGRSHAAKHRAVAARARDPMTWDAVAQTVGLTGYSL
eukprot:2221165-Rhodomonas_salina.2